jgi:hypothetical protein
MAAKRKKTRRATRASGSGAGFGQKLVVVLSLCVLVLCAASVTWSFFVRKHKSGVESQSFTIEVLNGTGDAGVAHEATKALFRLGIDVIEVGNADHFGYEESVLIARKQDADVGLLGEIIQCRNVIVQLRQDSIVDATLILGDDYRKLNLGWPVD